MFRALTIVVVTAALAVSAAPASAASKGSGGSGVGRVGGKMHLDDISMGIITDDAPAKGWWQRR